MSSTKLLMRWNVEAETDSEYFEFLVHEFIPGLNKLGVLEIQVWYTQYGECEQKLASGITKSMSDMKKVLQSPEWTSLIEKLSLYVSDFSKKVVPATHGFQL